ISAAAAKCALVIGPVVFYLINFAFFDEIQSWLMPLLGTEHPVHFLHFLAFVFVLTVVLMVAISAVRPAAWKPAPEDALAVDMEPWRHVKIASAAIVIATLAFYIALAQ
ncbi:MAG: solute:sodium symporter family transporter, partial [Woeseiaceae bacterium]